MSEAEPAATELQSQYAAQVSADLDRNAEEQERISAELVALDERLRALRHDRTLLAELQRALGGDGSAQAAPKAEKGSAPAPSVPRQTTAAKRKKAATTKAAAKSGTAKSAAAKPTLVELIREHLGRQSEPRSSAEVATALAESHPEREIKPKVVRTTVEGLVAKGQVRRTKQGSSVFYTTSTTTPADKEQ
jgi:hypothetical protein